MADYAQRFRTLDIRFRCGGCVRFKVNRKKNGSYRCCAVCGPEEVTADRIACLEYWDKRKQDQEEAADTEMEERKRKQRWKRNAHKPPILYEWEDDFDGITDTLREGELPVCPNCREPLYETERCYFCGQAILSDERLAEKLSPPEVERMDCFMCGGKATLEFTRSKINGHKSGHCTQCGMRFIE